MADVKIYTKTTCPACVLAKQILEQKGVGFQEFNMDDKPNELEALISQTGMKTVPQVFINGQLIGGCSDMINLDRQNKLDILLKADAP